ncbi:hypothetical protein GF420_04230, partial [candidate division GN15 bacterium]|nr:hypothetical protein [candidate division GN15 bacterium]
MFRRLLIAFVLCLIPAIAAGQISDDGLPVKTITDADIVGTVNFSNDTVYNLDGFVFVDSGEVLNIEAGTIIKANPGQAELASALIVSQGGTLNATGTESAPVVFTSTSDDLDDPNDIPAGDAGRKLWGGVILLGYATINTTAGVGNIEGLPPSARTEYGGSIDDDNSGTLTYVSIRHGGSVFGTADEINGLTMGGVGNGTTIEYVEIFQNFDDGFEWFGGTVRMKHAVAAFCGDDGFDIDEGWSGGVQYAFTIQDEEDSGNTGEHDGGTTPENGTPFATPVFSNATYLGAGYQATTSANPGGFNVRDNCSPAYYNSIFHDINGYGIIVEQTGSEPTDSEDRLLAGDIVYQNNVWGLHKAGSTPAALANGQSWTETLFTNSSFQNRITDPGIYSSRLADQQNDPRPKNTGSKNLPSWTDPTAYDPPAKPGFGATFAGFFEDVDYVGAFDPDANIGDLWVANWSAFDFYGYLGANDGGCGGITDDGKPIETITDADIVGDVFWSSDTVYNLDGFVFVDSGETLTIEAGTIIKANPGQAELASALIVSQGGQIFAQGTKDCPIIFTSTSDDIDDPNDIPAGDAGRKLWGGVILLGYATINTTAGVGNIEGLPPTDRTEYGGSIDNDNSGVLRYVSIRHGGSVFGTADEINGLTMGGVGNGTTIDYVEIFQNFDDGYEWFGGTVRVKHAIAAFCGDDGFDIDEGWSGGVQYAFTIQDEEDAGNTGEHDGGTTPENGTPFATPVFSNATYLGAGYQASTSANPGGFNVRDNCSPAYYNSIFHDINGYGIIVEQTGSEPTDSEDRLLAGDIVYQNNVWGLHKAGSTPAALANGQSWTETLFTDASFNNRIFDPGIYVSRVADQQNDPRPKNTGAKGMKALPDWTDPTAYNPPAKPNFGQTFAGWFDQVDYVGAFDPNTSIDDNWMKTWSAFDYYGYLGENDGGCGGITDNGKPTKTITDADITGDVFFSSDTVYNLDGFVFVESGETLTIEAGTIIKANPGQAELASALIVAQGGQIFANGTRECPIIFTSTSDDVDDPNDIPAGDAGRKLWGGVILLGEATINTTAGVGNIEGLPPSALTEYGGTTDNDNSGVLRYVSIRHGGSVFGTADEINGLTMGGVGNGTTIEHVEVFQNFDDGYEWFGGTVRMRYAIAAFCGDDGFDIDEGWSGAVQFAFTIQDEEDAGNTGEHDGGTTPENGTPFATPVFSNATYLGAGYQASTSANPGGFNVRDNCSPAYYNSIFHDINGYGIIVEQTGSEPTDSEDRLLAGDLVYQNNAWGLHAAGNTPADLTTGQS